MTEANIPDSSLAWRPGGLSRNLEEAVACVALTVVVLATSWGVFTRYVSAMPATWAAEIAAAGFCWAIFFGAAAVIKRTAHVSIDVAVSKLPPKARAALAWAVDISVLGFLAWVSWLALVFTVDSWDTPLPSLRWPYSIHYAGASLGLVAMTFRQAEAMLRRRSAA